LKKAAEYSGGQFYSASFNDKEAVPGSNTAGGASWERITLQGTDTWSNCGSAVMPFGATNPRSTLRPHSGCVVRAEIQNRSWFTGYVTTTADVAPGISAGQSLTGEILEQQREVSNKGPDPKAQTIPFRIYAMQYSGNWQYLGNVNNLRYAEINGKNFGEIYDDGTDKWKFYPVFLKDESDPYPDNRDAHSGTFGFAVKYDGA
jgi:hypothetical protein